MKDKYEISLWEDYFDNGQYKERNIAYTYLMKKS